MSAPDTERGYLDTEDDGYLEGPYLGGEFEDVFGMQVQMVVNAAPPLGAQVNMIAAEELEFGQQVHMTVNDESNYGMQVLSNIVDHLDTHGMQIDLQIAESLALGMQTNLTINDAVEIGQQVNVILNNDPFIAGMSVEMNILNRMVTAGMSVINGDTLRHALCDVYLEHGYLEEPYLTECMHGFMGMQVHLNNNTTVEFGMQIDQIIGEDESDGQQVEMIVNTEKLVGQQVEMIIMAQYVQGQQVEMIVNFEHELSQQVEMIVNFEDPTGMQVEQITIASYGMQSTMVIYNATQLRVMTEFPSRGTTALGGNNWTASSTAAGDYQAANLNTDIVEQIYRSGNGTASLVELVCDTGIPQGVPIDTIAILGHNLTKSATVQVQGSNDNFATAPNIVFNMTVELENMYYISPEFPTQAGQNRYWKFIIQDPTNPAGFVQIGTLVFGVTDIFSKAECFTNPINNGFRHFKDSFQTEGFTSVANDRALKKWMRLRFEKLNFFKGNYRILDDMIKFARTSLKVLVIPTPEYPSRFAIFGKLTQMPEISNTSIDATTQYIDLELEWDESL